MDQRQRQQVPQVRAILASGYRTTRCAGPGTTSIRRMPSIRSPASSRTSSTNSTRNTRRRSRPFRAPSSRRSIHRPPPPAAPLLDPGARRRRAPRRRHRRSPDLSARGRRDRGARDAALVLRDALLGHALVICDRLGRARDHACARDGAIGPPSRPDSSPAGRLVPRGCGVDRGARGSRRPRGHARAADPRHRAHGDLDGGGAGDAPRVSMVGPRHALRVARARALPRPRRSPRDALAGLLDAPRCVRSEHGAVAPPGGALRRGVLRASAPSAPDLRDRGPARRRVRRARRRDRAPRLLRRTQPDLAGARDQQLLSRRADPAPRMPAARGRARRGRASALVALGHLCGIRRAPMRSSRRRSPS